MPSPSSNTQRPVINLERVALEIFDLVAASPEPIGVDKLYQHFGKRALTLPLNGNSLHQHMEDMLAVGYFTGHDPHKDPYTMHTHYKYQLSAAGEAERQRLRGLVDRAGG